jgi:phage FluMu protein Com
MGVKVTDLRCPTPMCGKKLADAVYITAGGIEVRIKCDRCKRVVVVKA